MENVMVQPQVSPATRSVGKQTSTTRSEAGVSRAALWTGRGLSGFITLALALDCVMKLVQHPEAVKGTAELGYPASAVFVIGVIQLVCLLAYVIPRTAVLGAVLLTGYLGGAIATHVRLGNPLFTHVLSPVYVAAFIWGGLYLRDRAVRAVLPFVKPGAARTPTSLHRSPK